LHFEPGAKMEIMLIKSIIFRTIFKVKNVMNLA
jgi:hypothetical protein